MSILISADQITKAYGARPLFEKLVFTIESGERIGLIGPNGAGKSTLLKILAQKSSPDEGKLAVQKGLRVGYLEQTPEFKPGISVHEAILEGTDDPYEWENMALADEIASKLSLPEGQVSHLSGGWKKRVALARELARKPDLLLLDEPTNHLDVEGILWLEDHLERAAFATLTVTHDRYFLQRVSSRILELDRRNAGGILSIRGDYAAYVETKEQMLSSQERREVVLKNTLRRETEWLRQGAKARTTKQQARIKRAHELADEVSELEVRNRNLSARIEMQSAEKNPKRLVEAKKVSKTIGSKKLFSGVDLVLRPKTRIGLLGPNGCGKSTLIRVLLGHEKPTSGEVTRSEHLEVAYFEQSRESLDPNLTLYRTLCPTGDHVDFRGARVHIRSYLDRFLFSSQQMEMQVGKLSGGEQSRILIAKLMLTQANLLVLDEPTNDLDLPTLGVLEESLVDFPGAVLLVTHDRYFLRQVATQILSFESSELVSFATLEQWESWKRSQPTATERAKPVETSTSEKPSAKKKKLSYNEQRELSQMEQNIKSAEAELSQLEEESARPENQTNAVLLSRLSRTMAELQSKISRLYDRWAELEGEPQ